jgi:hypothetical protein
MSTSVVRNTNRDNPAVNGIQCRVYVRSPSIGVTVTFPVDSLEGAACLAEHDAFTPVDPPPVPPGGANTANPCFLESL